MEERFFKNATYPGKKVWIKLDIRAEILVRCRPGPDRENVAPIG